MPSFMSPTETVERLTQRLFPDHADDSRHHAHALWWSLYPALILFCSFAIDLVLVYVLFPQLDKRAFAPPRYHQLKAEYCFGRAMPELAKTLRGPHCMEQNIEKVKDTLQQLVANLRLNRSETFALVRRPIDSMSSISGHASVSDEDLLPCVALSCTGIEQS